MMLSVLDAAAEAPDQVALILGDQEATFGELGERVAGRMLWLADRGIPTGDARPVAMVGSSDTDTLELLYALIEVGQPVALVHPRLTSAERRAVVALAEPVLSVEKAPPLDGDAPSALASVARGSAPGQTAVDTHGAATPGALHVDPERPLAILFTSGTTGAPKGIVLSRRAFAASAVASEQNLGWRPDDRWLLGLPIAHVGGLSILTRCLMARRPVVVPSEVQLGARLDVEALIRAIDSTHTTIVSLVPTQLEWLLARQPTWSPPPHLRAVLLGGAAARPALLERAADRGVPVLTTYGLTEACSQVTTEPVGTILRGEAGVGFPMPGVEVRLVEGAIQVRGPTLLSGYCPPLAAAATDADGWFHTDDLGRFDAEGRLHILGRRSDVIITGGENVFPAEVEAVLERCPRIAAACVFGVADDTWGELVAVALVPSTEGPPSDDVLEAFQRDHLAQHRRPRLVAIVTELGATPAGKLDRKSTRERALPLLRRL
jgi:O-succinylbenzoic acid--CoA ligase